MPLQIMYFTNIMPVLFTCKKLFRLSVGFSRLAIFTDLPGLIGSCSDQMM